MQLCIIMSQFVGWDSYQMLVCNSTIITLMECRNNFDNDTHPVITYDKLFPGMSVVTICLQFLVC